MEPSTLKRQHAKATEQATAILRKQTGRQDITFQGFELYTLRHTCLTRWAPCMDPWTLAYLAGHRDMNITKRYVHPKNARFWKRWSECAARLRVGIQMSRPQVCQSRQSRY